MLMDRHFFAWLISLLALICRAHLSIATTVFQAATYESRQFSKIFSFSRNRSRADEQPGYRRA
jgi:hypothetical protein